MRIGRVLGVTALLGLLGGLAGALGGLLLVAGIALAISLPPEVGSRRVVFAIASAVGFGFGVVVGPALAWAFLRHVPIWRAIGETAIAAGLGATLALVFSGNLWVTFGSALAASVLAAVRLRRAYRSRRAAPAGVP